LSVATEKRMGKCQRKSFVKRFFSKCILISTWSRDASWDNEISRCQKSAFETLGT
jgi:hypothetical protein